MDKIGLELLCLDYAGILFLSSLILSMSRAKIDTSNTPELIA